MGRKFIAAAASGVLALTMTAALPTIHAAAVSIWNDITPGTESVETFQYKELCRPLFGCLRALRLRRRGVV